MFLAAENDPIHVAAANANHRRAAGLALERGQTERLLHARMNEQIGRAIKRASSSESVQYCRQVTMPDAFLQSAQLRALQAVADHQQVIALRIALGEQREGGEQSLRVLFLGQPPDVEQKTAFGRNA